jgi:hypothetical protein
MEGAGEKQQHYERSDGLHSGFSIRLVNFITWLKKGREFLTIWPVLRVLFQGTDNSVY